MAAKNVDIKINTTATGNGAQQAAAQMDKLAASSTKAATATNAVTTSTSNLGYRAGAVGLQMQDIAVQAQMGTSAVTILAQQGTQIASIFGPQGAIIGALIGVGAVAGKVFYDMAVAAAVTGEAMEDMSDKLKDAFGEQAKKAIEDFNTQLKNQESVAESLREVEVDLLQARLERESADAALISSQAALEAAAVKYLGTTGQILNVEKELAKIRKAEAEAQKAAQIQDIENQVTVARERYKNFSAQYEEVQGQTDQAQKRLAELEKRQQELMSSLSFSRRMDAQSREFGSLGQDETSAETNALTAQMDALKKEIGGIYKIINEAPQRLSQITNEAIVSAASLQSLVEDAESQIAQINEKYNLTQSAQTLTTATASLTQGAKEIEEKVEQLETIGPVQEQAKQQILQAVRDGEINAQDQVAIGQNLSILMSTLKTGQSEQLSAIRELIQLNSTIATQMQSANNEIKALRTKVQALQAVR
jgi:DNA repair exonuclease SbcCD ATPase subunit